MTPEQRLEEKASQAARRAIVELMLLSEMDADENPLPDAVAELGAYFREAMRAAKEEGRNDGLEEAAQRVTDCYYDGREKAIALHLANRIRALKEPLLELASS